MVSRVMLPGILELRRSRWLREIESLDLRAVYHVAELGRIGVVSGAEMLF